MSVELEVRDGTPELWSWLSGQQTGDVYVVALVGTPVTRVVAAVVRRLHGLGVS